MESGWNPGVKRDPNPPAAATAARLGGFYYVRAHIRLGIEAKKGQRAEQKSQGRADVPRLDAPIVVWKWWTHVANDGLAGGARLLVPRDFDTRAAECIAESTWAHALSSSTVLPKLVRVARVERSAHV